MHPERRRQRRFAVDVPARIEAGQDRQVARVRDICRDAVLVEADRWYPLKTRVGVSLELPGTQGELQLSGEIIRLAPGDQGSHGMAVLFSDLSQAASDRIDQFITRQEAG